MEEAEQGATVCAEGTSVEAPLALTCTQRSPLGSVDLHRNQRWVYKKHKEHFKPSPYPISTGCLPLLFTSQVYFAACTDTKVHCPWAKPSQCQPQAPGCPPSPGDLQLHQCPLEPVSHIFQSSAPRRQWEFQELLPCSACKYL